MYLLYYVYNTARRHKNEYYTYKTCIKQWDVWRASDSLYPLEVHLTDLVLSWLPRLSRFFTHLLLRLLGASVFFPSNRLRRFAFCRSTNSSISRCVALPLCWMTRSNSAEISYGSFWLKSKSSFEAIGLNRSVNLGAGAELKHSCLALGGRAMWYECMLEPPIHMSSAAAAGPSEQYESLWLCFSSLS